MALNDHTRRESSITVVRNMRDYSNDPFIIKKVDKARTFIAKHGLPENDKSVKKGK